MKNVHYTIRLHAEQLKYLYSSLLNSFNEKFFIDNIDHITFYNVRSFIKRLENKLYQLNGTMVNVATLYRIPIDMNEYEALRQLYALCHETIEHNTYVFIIYTELFRQCDKQETDFLQHHLYNDRPTGIVAHKLKSDNLKKLEP